MLLIVCNISTTPRAAQKMIISKKVEICLWLVIIINGGKKKTPKKRKVSLGREKVFHPDDDEDDEEAGKRREKVFSLLWPMKERDVQGM